MSLSSLSVTGGSTPHPLVMLRGASLLPDQINPPPAIAPLHQEHHILTLHPRDMYQRERRCRPDSRLAQRPVATRGHLVQCQQLRQLLLAACRLQARGELLVHHLVVPTRQRRAIGIQRPGRRGLVPQQDSSQHREQHHAKAAQHEPASLPQPGSTWKARPACWEREGARCVLPRGLGCRPGRGCWHLGPQRTAPTGVCRSWSSGGSHRFIALLVEEEHLTEADAIPGREQVGHVRSEPLFVEEGPRAAAQVDQTVAASPTQAGGADLDVMCCDAGTRDDQVIVWGPSNDQDGCSKGDVA